MQENVAPLFITEYFSSRSKCALLIRNEWILCWLQSKACTENLDFCNYLIDRQELR